MVVGRTFHTLSSQVNSQHLLAFVDGGPMPNADEMASSASSLLQTESKAKT